MISIIKHYKIVFFLCIFTVSLVLNLAVQKYQYPSQDANQNDLFSSLLIEHGTFRYKNELNQKLDPPIFGIRGLLNYGNGFVPSVLPGFVIILALFKTVSSKIVFLINPIFVVIGLYYFYKIIDKYIFKNNFSSLTTTLVYLFSGAFLYVSSIPLKDLPATSLFFIGLFYSLNAIYDKRGVDFLLFGLFAGAATWLCYPNIIFYFPIAILYLLNIKRDFLKRENLKNLTVCFVPFLVMLFPLYIYQLKLFNGFLNFTQPLFQLNHFAVYTSKRGILNFILALDSHKFFVNFYNQIFLVSPLLIFFCLLALIFIFLNYKKEKRVNNILIAFSAIILMQFLFYLGKTWSGDIFIGSVGTSYARYLLISWGLLTVLAIYVIRKLIYQKLILIVLTIFFIISGLNKGLNSDYAIKFSIDTSKWANDLKEKIALKTPENSIFFTSIYDKFIYPARQTAVYVAIPKDERLNKTISLMKTLLNDNFPVYIVDEKFVINGEEWTISLEKNNWFFVKNGLDIKYAFGGIYKIEKGD